MDYREEMKQLRDFLNQQSYLYYVLDAPLMTVPPPRRAAMPLRPSP